MMKAALAKWLLLCFLYQVERANGQTNLTTIDVDVGAYTTSPTSSSGGGNSVISSSRAGCLCDGRGELKEDQSLDWLPAGSLDYLEQDLPDSLTCGDIQALFTDAAECPEVLWLTYCCTNGPSYSQCASQVRKQILGGGYDKLTIPSTDYDPTIVQVQMTYITVTDIDSAEGTMEVFVWLNLTWNDPRLAWEYDPSPNGTCTSLFVNARAEKQQGLKDSEIWVPEFDLYNQISSVNGMIGNLATITSDGTVRWFRQGRLKAICQMENLGEMPYETLGCQLLMGSWTHGVRYELNPAGGLLISDYAGPYNGYRLVHGEPGYQSDGWVLFFNLDFQRGTKFFIQNVIVPVSVFTYCSIGTMVIGVGAFQTLALNFTLLLVTVAQRIAVSRLLPVTNERVWIVDYVSGSFYFIIATLAVTFFKFIILAIREEHPAGNGEDPEGNAERPLESKSPSWVYTLSMRRLDVTCCTLNFLLYTLFIIVSFAANDAWGKNIDYPISVNGSTWELFDQS